MDAGLDLLASADGARAFTVRGVCRSSGLASRYFYENFDDSGALARAIYDHEVLDLTTATLATMDGVPADDLPLVARTAIGAVIGHIAEDPRRGRLLFSPALVALPAIAERRQASTRLFAGLFRDELLLRVPTAGGPSLEVAAEMMIGGLGQVVDAWLDQEITLSEEELVDAFSDVLTQVALSFVN